LPHPLKRTWEAPAAGCGALAVDSEKEIFTPAVNPEAFASGRMRLPSSPDVSGLFSGQQQDYREARWLALRILLILSSSQPAGGCL